MEIIRATLKDIETIVDMKMKMSEELGISHIFQDNIEEKIKEEYTKLYNEDKCSHYLVYEENKIVAIGGAVIKTDIPFCFFKTPYYGYIIDIYCIPEKRRNGYATQIIESILNLLKEKDIKIVKLKASEDGKLLYEKMGFYNSGEMELMITDM
ncbi:MAG: GNAT family N-acetyltransferase [Bacilli bacterium]|nr:GNAT family N-acetyltransferase [Bacilli bacterium]